MKRSRSARVRVVERAGGLELRVDDTYASLLRPGRVTTGSVWDALALPILALPPARRRRVLILGLGGGSAARLVRALAPAAQIVGVELDREVLAAARKHLGLAKLGIDTVCDDAREYVRTTRRRFDLVIDDVFVGEGDGVRKPEWYPEPGLHNAWARVARGGLLVTNSLDEAPALARELRTIAPARVRIRIEGYDNQVLVAGPSALAARALRAAVRAEPLLAETLPRLRINGF